MLNDFIPCFQQSGDFSNIYTCFIAKTTKKADIKAQKCAIVKLNRPAQRNGLTPELVQ